MMPSSRPLVVSPLSGEAQVDHLVRFVEPLALPSPWRLGGWFRDLWRNFSTALPRPGSHTAFILPGMIWIWANRRNTLVDFEILMLAMAALLVFRARQKLTCSNLLGWVPIRQADIYQTLLRFAFHDLRICVAAWALLIFFRRWDVWLQGWEASLVYLLGMAQNVVVLVCLLTILLLVDTPMAGPRGTIPRHRQMYLLAQTLLLLAARATAIHVFDIEGWALVGIQVGSLLLLVGLAICAWRRQLAAAYHVRWLKDSRTQRSWRKGPIALGLLVAALVFLQPLKSSAGPWLTWTGIHWAIRLQGVVLAGLWIYQGWRLGNLRARGMKLVVRCFDVGILLALTGVQVAAWLGSLRGPWCLGAELGLLALWLAWQEGVESPRQATLESMSPTERGNRRAKDLHRSRRARGRSTSRRLAEQRYRALRAGELGSLQPMTAGGRLAHLRRMAWRRSSYPVRNIVWIVAVWVGGYLVWSWLPGDKLSSSYEPLYLIAGYVAAVVASCLIPSRELVAALPVRPGEIVRSHLRVGAEGAALAILGILFWQIAQHVWLEGGELDALVPPLLQGLARLSSFGLAYLLTAALILPIPVLHPTLQQGRGMVFLAMFCIAVESRVVTPAHGLSSQVSLWVSCLAMACAAMAVGLVLRRQLTTVDRKTVLPLKQNQYTMLFPDRFGDSYALYFYAWVCIPGIQVGGIGYGWRIAQITLLLPLSWFFSVLGTNIKRRQWIALAIDTACLIPLVVLPLAVWFQRPPHRLEILPWRLEEGELLAYRLSIVVVWLLVQVVMERKWPAGAPSRQATPTEAPSKRYGTVMA